MRGPFPVLCFAHAVSSGRRATSSDGGHQAVAVLGAAPSEIGIVASAAVGNGLKSICGDAIPSGNQLRHIAHG
jgi:hypothetical protein